MATTNLRFVAKNGLDNNSNSIANLGVAGASLTLSGANSLVLTTAGATNVTLPTSGTLATLDRAQTWSALNTFSKAGVDVNPTLKVKAGTYEVSLNPQASAGTGNSLVAANDSVIMFTGTGAVDTGALTIAPWSTSTSGIRLIPGTNTLHGQTNLVGTTNCVVNSQGLSGYGAFYAKSSGVNNSYLFMGNVTDGEQARLTAGSGGLYVSTGVAATLQFQVAPVASAVNWVRAAGNIIGNPPAISAQGSDTNINLAILAKGTGTVTTPKLQVTETLTLDNPAGNANIEIGRTNGVASTPYIDFHSGATAVDFDARITASGGSGVNGDGVLSVNARSIAHSTAANSAYCPQYNLVNTAADNTAGYLILDKRRPALAAAQSGDSVGNLLFRPWDGTTMIGQTGIIATVTGAVSTGIAPTQLSFYTNSPTGTTNTALILDNLGNASLSGNIGLNNLLVRGGNITGAVGDANFISIYGGGSYNTGAGISLFGASHATKANKITITNGAYVERLTIDAAGAVYIGGSVTASSFLGNATSATTAGTVTTAAQPAITSVGTLTSLDVSGNLAFSGTGNRITGDFSNGTVGSRALVQTSVTNGDTSWGIIPNGTSVGCSTYLFNSTDLANTSFFGLMQNATESFIRASKLGTGVYQPIVFQTSNTERLRIDAAGAITIGGTVTAGAFLGNATSATNIAGGAAGSLPYQTASGTTTMLAAGTNGYVLTLAAGVPTWAVGGGGGGTATSVTPTDDITTSTPHYPLFTGTTTGTDLINTSSTKLTYVPGTGTLSAVVFNSLSDSRAKTNIRDIGYGLADVLRMTGHKFEMKESGQTSIGLIAQEVKEIIPEIISKSVDDMLGVNYPVLTAVLIEAIKELTARIEVLEAK